MIRPKRRFLSGVFVIIGRIDNKVAVNEFDFGVVGFVPRTVRLNFFYYFLFSLCMIVP